MENEIKHREPVDDHIERGLSNQRWSAIVNSVKEDDPKAFGQLYEGLLCLQHWFQSRIGAQRSEDAYHDLIVELVTQIRRGAVRRPDRIAGYAKAMASNMLCGQIEELILARRAVPVETCRNLRDRKNSAETHVIQDERTEIATRILAAMPERDRELLVRFYVHGQKADDIQAAMGMSPTQFRLTKSRAKARYAQLCQNRFARREPASMNSECRVGAVANLAA